MKQLYWNVIIYIDAFIVPFFYFNLQYFSSQFPWSSSGLMSWWKLKTKGYSETIIALWITIDWMSCKFKITNKRLLMYFGSHRAWWRHVHVNYSLDRGRSGKRLQMNIEYICILPNIICLIHFAFRTKIKANNIDVVGLETWHQALTGLPITPVSESLWNCRCCSQVCRSKPVCSNKNVDDVFLERCRWIYARGAWLQGLEQGGPNGDLPWKCEENGGLHLRIHLEQLQDASFSGCWARFPAPVVSR